MKVKEESEKVGLKLNIPKTKIMASGPITSWEIDGETVADFIFGGSKFTADFCAWWLPGDCSHEIKRCLLLGRKDAYSMLTNLESILKIRDITLPTKVHLVKAIGFSSGHVRMWEMDYKESWAPKNWCFWTVVLEKTLESLGLQGVPTSPSQRKSVLGVCWKDWCWSWNSNTLATWCKELTHLKRFWFWERLRAGEGDNRGRDGWMASPTQWTWVWVNSRSWWWTRRPGVLWFIRSQRVRHDWATELNWTDDSLNSSFPKFIWIKFY